MPDMTGPQLLGELRRLRPKLPAILMSGYGGPDLQRQAQAAGAEALLMKPLTAAELAGCLAAVLRPEGPAGHPVDPGARREVAQS